MRFMYLSACRHEKNKLSCLVCVIVPRLLFSKVPVFLEKEKAGIDALEAQSGLGGLVFSLNADALDELEVEQDVGDYGDDLEFYYDDDLEFCSCMDVEEEYREFCQGRLRMPLELP